MQYNTQKTPIRMKAYGREVQEMIDHALKINDKTERTAYAHCIVETMRIVSRQILPQQEIATKLWNHLAQMACGELDVDYPCEIEPHTTHIRPARLTYPSSPPRFRHYGHLLELWIGKIAKEQDMERRKAMIRQLSARMRRNLSEQRGGIVETTRLAHDIALYSEGKIPEKEVLTSLG